MPTRSEGKIWRSLRRRKGRDATGLFLLEGPRLLAEALATGTPTEAILYTERDDPTVRDLLSRAEAEGRRVEAVGEAALADIAEAVTPQPLLAIAPVPAWGWDDLGPGLVVLLDGVQDPGNVGTLIRTAVALGAAGTVALGETADPWSPKVVRAAAGASLRAPVFRDDRGSALAALRRREAALWAAAADGEPVPVGRAAPGALALGSEAHGVSPQLTAAADRRVSIGMSGGMESLNVAAAGAILLDRLLSGR